MSARMLVLNAAVAALVASNVAFAEYAPPRLVASPVEKVFVALGFDDNDDVELVVHGHFRNTCYKVGPVSAVFDASSGIIDIKAESYLYQGGCAQVLVNFTQSVKVGLLPEGTYEVRVNGESGRGTAPLVVTHAISPNPDDFLYAPVTDATLTRGEDGDYVVTISGEFPYMLVGCMVLTDINAYVSPGNTIVVQPIAALVDDERCDDQQTNHKFAADKSIGLLKPGEFLTHVRVTDGNSVNRFFDL